MRISRKAVILAGIAVVVLIALCSPFSSLEARESITLESGKTAENLFVVGKDINIYGTVEESAVSVGGDIHVHGTVDENAVSIGGNVYVENGGHIDDSAVTLGGDVLVRSNGSVEDNAVTFGGSLALEPGGSVGGKLVDLSGMAPLFHHNLHITGHTILKRIVLGPFFGAFGVFGTIIGLIITVAKLMVSLAFVFILSLIHI
jgi:carbonic anhydrase/acetyltransferase-like protein (isoleucine patch superfamily)